MKRALLAALLALVAMSWGCVGYHNGYDSSYSPGCYSCGHRHEHEHEDHHGYHRGRDGGGHHRHHDHDDDHHHHRRH